MHDKLYEGGDICINGRGEIFVQDKTYNVPYKQIRMPVNEDDKPSPLRLNQKLGHSLS